jgi:hypothetical protein
VSITAEALCVPRGIGGLGFLCMLEALCVVLVYLEALDAFFLGYNTLTYLKKMSVHHCSFMSDI